MSDDYEDQLRDLLKRATAPVAVVVAPGALADPQAFADAERVEVREWAGCTAGVYYVRSVGEQPMGELVATPTGLEAHDQPQDPGPAGPIDRTT